MKIRSRLKKILIVVTFIVALLLGVSYLATTVSPSQNRWIPMFGLAYPVFFLLTILLFIFWVLKRKWLAALIPLVAILIGWNIHPHFFQLAGKGSPEKDTAKDISVLSYNVRLFNLYNWTDNSSTRDSIFGMLQNEDADILCFQEFYYTARKGVFETRDTLIKILPNKYYQEKYTHKFTGEQYFGVATFSRYPIINKGEIPFESDDNNYCIYSDIAVDDDTIRVYNAHLSSIRFDREDYEFVSNDSKSGKDFE